MNCDKREISAFFIFTAHNIFFNCITLLFLIVGDGGWGGGGVQIANFATSSNYYKGMD